MRTARVRTMTMTMRLIDGSRRRFPGRASGVSPRVQALAILGVTVLLLGCNTQASGPSTMTTANGSANGSAAAPGDGSLRLVRGAHPFARPEFDIGPLDPERRLTNLAVVFRLSPQQKIDRDALLVAQLDPASPSYHKWLTPDEYAARFGAKAADIARTRAWLAQQ